MMMNILLIQGGSSLLWTILPFALIFGIFYFLVILPQRRQQQELKTMIAALKNGDEVVTNGGIIGKIIEVRETSFIIRSADKSIMEIGKAAVVGKRADEKEK
ncbi:MAG: preprotein translocase subunit YajC [Acidobacteria bacterium]|nr:MAG: preprotein translocase subunit YajC [Acidobacteriota bacterium]REK01922.1 MAG: preprotein translocase subunit YajC [Acidobacteriota bacterium]REK14878.1 MAG: preprotein translocase subunit YajC [Acidobacteriota bacterium]REK45593.1 MAG: preprotein translocase subunit YajC [Acidobacteriota bacterium]